MKSLITLISCIKCSSMSRVNANFCHCFALYFRTEDAETIFGDAQALNLTVEGYMWIVSEQALDAVNIPIGTYIFLCPMQSIYLLVHIYFYAPCWIVRGVSYYLFRFCSQGQS